MNADATPKNFQDFSVSLDFGSSDQLQPLLEASNLEFVGDAARFIINHFNQGKIFEGLPFDILVSLNGITTEVKLLIDLSQDFQIISSNEVSVSVINRDTTGLFSKQIEGISVAYMNEKLNFNKEIITVCKVAKFDRVEIASSLILITLMTIEVIRATKDIAEQTANFVSKAVMGSFGSLGAAVFAGAVLTVNIAFYIALLSAYKQLITDFLNSILPFPKKFAVIKIYDVLQKIINNLGYNQFIIPDELKDLRYLPSYNSESSLNTKGIPRASDFGYSASDMLELLRRICNGKLIVDNDKNVILLPVNHEYFKKNSNFKLPDVLNESFTLNTDEFTPNQLISYDSDTSDIYTLDNYRGTSYEINSEITGANKNLATVGGLDDIFIPVCRTNSKTELTGLEKIVDKIFDAFSAMANFMDQDSSNSVPDFTKTIGCLKVENESWSLPRIFKGSTKFNGKYYSLPDNHNRLTAKKIYNDYYKQSSFTEQGQKYVYSNVSIPMNLRTFNDILTNSYFTTSSGYGKVTALSWNIENDTANISYYIEKKYTNNLSVSYREQD